MKFLMLILLIYSTVTTAAHAMCERQVGDTVRRYPEGTEIEVQGGKIVCRNGTWVFERD